MSARKKTVKSLCEIANLAKLINPNITIFIATLLIGLMHPNFTDVMHISDELHTLFDCGNNDFASHEMGGVVLLDWVKCLLHAQALQSGGHSDHKFIDLWTDSVHISDVGVHMFILELECIKFR